MMFKDNTDLAGLPVADAIDVKLQRPYCELCGEEFKNSVNKSRNKRIHLMGHFREDIMKDLPSMKPFKCPKCTFLGKDSLELSHHYGFNHKVSRFDHSNFFIKFQKNSSLIVLTIQGRKYGTQFKSTKKDSFITTPNKYKYILLKSNSNKASKI